MDALKVQKRKPAVKKHSKTTNQPEYANTGSGQPAITIGIDVGDRESHFCQLNAEGNITHRGRVASTQDAFRKQFGKVGRSRIALETGTHCHWMSDVLRDLGHEVIVADARELKSIFASRR